MFICLLMFYLHGKGKANFNVLYISYLYIRKEGREIPSISKVQRLSFCIYKCSVWMGKGKQRMEEEVVLITWMEWKSVKQDVRKE